MSLPDLPHLDLPFRFENGEMAVVDQDSPDDFENQILAVVLCPLGFRSELPEFGVDQPEFGRMPLDTTSIQAAVDEWVPNANATFSEQDDALNEAITTLRATLNADTV